MFDSLLLVLLLLLELLFGDVICVRNMDVGRPMAVTTDDDDDDGTIDDDDGGGGAGGNGNWAPPIDTGKNVDVLRNDVVDEFGDNGLRWYS